MLVACLLLLAACETASPGAQRTLSRSSPPETASRCRNTTKPVIETGNSVPSSKATSAKTKVLVDAGTRIRRISRDVFGVNHRFPFNGYGMWDSDRDEPYPEFLTAFEHGGFTSVRFPGGRVANTYHWKRAIGPLKERTPNASGGGQGQPLSSNFGPDEFGELLDKTGASGSIVVNFATGDSQEAANWVEYMNAPVGTNPNGNTAWAEVRAANGHPEPYSIRYWEVGNEMNSDKVYWMGDKTPTAELAKKYAFGGSTAFHRDIVSSYADRGLPGATSDGTPNQVFFFQYPPVQPGTRRLFVDGRSWSTVPDLTAEGKENVYEFDPDSGRIQFGNGHHGNIPARGSLIRSSYVSGPHDGFVDFYAAMKDVDPSIRVGTAVHTSEFLHEMGAKNPYDFVVLHSYGHIYEPIDTLTKIHDYTMQLPRDQGDELEQLEEEIASAAGADRAREIDLVLSEYGLASGMKTGLDATSLPLSYGRSIDNAVYIALLLREWIDTGVLVADKHSLIDIDTRRPPGEYIRTNTAHAALIGPEPCFVTSAAARVFHIYTEMTGIWTLDTEVEGNPVGQTYHGRTSPALRPLASIDRAGNLYLMVMNTDRKLEVPAHIGLSGFTASDTAEVLSLAGPDPLAYNTRRHPNRVRVVKSAVTDVSRNGLSYNFPPLSVTAFKIEPR